MKNRLVVVIGGAGYVGSELVQFLLDDGYQVRVLDTFWYGREHLEQLQSQSLVLVEGDMRDLNVIEKVLEDVTDVIHLACISNDPSFDLNPSLGKSINLDSFEPIVLAAKRAGVKRFIYASSSSVYGVKSESKVTEELSLEPLTDYSKFKAECEGILLLHADDQFVCTIVRPATVCGVSSRQRFDLSVNILTNHAINIRKITVFGGSQHRPNLHIKDMCRAYLTILSKPSDIIANKIYNVGSDNLTLDEIASRVNQFVSPTIPVVHQDTNDLRSYRVDSEFIKQDLGFEPIYKVDDAIKDLVLAFNKEYFDSPLENSRYFNIKKMKELGLG
ncbi:WcaG Nucleoside-diphosphate-sugar epimerases [Candidatus Nanopelagicaceae bacterium]